MRNEFNRHKRGDKVKWVFTGVAFVLVFVMLAGVFMQLFASDKFKPSNWFTKTEQTEELPEDTENGGGALITDTNESGGISLMSTAIDPADYDEYGVSAAAESAYTLTATVRVDDPTILDFTWSVAFKDPSSSWATGKTLSDYVTISGSGLTAIVSCLQAFGEPAIVSITYDFDDSVTASCQIDYLKSFQNASLIIDDSEMFGEVSFENSYTIFSANKNFGTGTVQGDVSLKVYFKFDESFIYDLKQNSYFKEFMDLYWSISGEYPQFQSNSTKVSYQDNMSLEFSLVSFLTCEYGIISRENDCFEYLKAAMLDTIYDYYITGYNNDVYLCYDYEYKYNNSVISNGSKISSYFFIDLDSISSSVYLTGVSLDESNLVFGM